MLPPLSAPVILFDGVCNLCNAWVRFVFRHDPARRLPICHAAVTCGPDDDQRARYRLSPTV